jgi:hypothetical protein
LGAFLNRSGKTLTALTVMSKIYSYNIETCVNNYIGFLVLLPTTKLYKTWTDEIEKHTHGFNIVTQNANGNLTGDINMNTVLITTLGRMRDHSIYESWQLVVIDECLSVQNKEALQTESAWKQVMSSQFGVVMMSATFFRSRFDKLFYMLKMLRSGLPEEKEYLNTILSECIVCHVPNKCREWITNINKFDLPLTMRKMYNKIAYTDIASDKLYVLLSKYLYDNFNYIKCFEKMINSLKNNQKALIYSKSKDEADKISFSIKSVTRYPNKKGKHVVVSYAEGTYGLNDLINYNVIITRPPQPDKLDQMKGRLDRPNQKCNILNLEYILVRNTIEEALLIRMEMANNFYKNHIMPLAEFYNIAVNVTKNMTIYDNDFLKNFDDLNVNNNADKYKEKIKQMRLSLVS